MQNRTLLVAMVLLGLSANCSSSKTNDSGSFGGSSASGSSASGSSASGSSASGSSGIGSGGSGASTGAAAGRAGAAGNSSLDLGGNAGSVSGAGGGGGNASGGSGGGGGAPVTAPTRAQIMQDCTYGGWHVDLAEGDYTRADLLARGFTDNDVSSLRVAPGFEIVLYDDDNFSGSSITYGTHTPCTTSGDFNDKASSLRVRKSGSAQGPAFKVPPGNVNTTFFVVSDTHADPQGGLDANTHESNLLATARAVNQVAAMGSWPTMIGGRATGFAALPIGAPDGGVVFSGDLIGYSQGALEYPTFERYFFTRPGGESIKYPAYVGLGNHDMDDPPGQRDYAWNWLDAHHKGAKAPVPVTAFDDASHSYSWDHGGVHFIHSNKAPGDTWAGQVSNFPFLQQDLAARAADGRPVFIFHHFGFDAFGTQDRWWTPEQRTTYGNLVVPYNIAAMVVGHSHYAYDLFMFDEGTRSDNRVVHVNNAKAEIDSGNKDGNGSFAIIRITNQEMWVVTCRWLNTAGDYELIAPFYRGPTVLLK